MSCQKIVIASVLIALMSAAVLIETVNIGRASPQSVHPSGLPKLNEIWYKAYPGASPDVIVEEFLEGVTDWIEGPYRKDLFEMVIAAGEKVLFANCSTVPEKLIYINCRDYDGATGAVNWPLNDSNFRLALSYIYGIDKKQEDIYSYVQAPWEYAASNILLPACPYYNESVCMPNTDWDMAWSILQNAGYYVEGGYLKKGGKIVRNMELRYSTGVLYWERGPGVGFVRAFNTFMAHIGATNGPTITAIPTAFGTLVTMLLFGYYDFICLGMQMHGYCPEIIAGLINETGINNTELSYYVEMWVNASPYSPEAYYAGFMVQYLCINELMPYFPVGGGMAVCTVARDSRGELMNIISVPGVCRFNRWSYMTIHWKGPPGQAWPGGMVRIALNNEWTTLNPFNESTVYGWRILNTVISPLLIENPNGGWLPWIATNMTVTPWISIPELGIKDGMKVTFYLRQDVYWHDLKPVTAHDCEKNMKLLITYKPSLYSRVWALLVYAEAEGPYTFEAYANKVDYYWPYEVAKVSLLVPKHIAQKIEEVGGNPLTWNFTKPYKELMGVDPPPQYPFLTQLVGCGPYVLDYASLSTLTAHVVKFNEFFVNAPVIGSVIGKWLHLPPPNPTPYTFHVLIQNMAAKSNDENGELTNATFYAKIYFDDDLIGMTHIMLLPSFAYLQLGPYTLDPSPGCHTIKVEVYDGETGELWHKYLHKFVVVVREDVTTYSGQLIDCKVNIADILKAALAYGHRPCKPKWDPACDVNDDYKVDIKDILAIALKYSWGPGC